MSSEWILDKNHLSYWLRQLRKEADLIGPLKKPGGDIVFESIERIHEIFLDLPALIPGPKEFLFPQYERLFNKRDSKVEELSVQRKRVVFGVRSCDVSAVRLLDRFFLDRFEDPFYSNRRANTLLISIVCNNPEPTCFCAGIGTGPYLREGYDIQLTDLGERYLVQAASKEGRRAIKAYSFIFSKPTKTDYDDQFEVQLSAMARFQKRISLERVRSMIITGKVRDTFWEKVATRCFECGGCVYECPLCTCFTVIDRVFGDNIERARIWDACLFKGFTRLAGGVLPNERMVMRTKRWYYHKLVHYPEVIGSFGCVGCGRCTVVCPAKIDMATVAIKIKALADNEEKIIEQKE